MLPQPETTRLLQPRRGRAAAVFLITTALVGIGLSARFRDMRRACLRPLALGAVLWATVGMSSLLLQLLNRQL
jgi:uncharacterized membrane protein YadS